MPSEGPTHTTPTARTWVLRSDEDVYEQRVEYAPASPFPPLHFHPAQDELFEIEKGAVVFVVDGAERTVAAGGLIEIAAGTPHKARNASTDEPAVVRWVTTPALRSADFFALAAKLGDDAGLFERALFAHEYRDVFRASGMLGRLIPMVAAIARLLGRRPPHLD
ncbi:MAG TPA: cupin domain-containing protein [Acidimicrobiia bacterium]|nr:cupin domain-containing protein [Acidimicrobiia bacterium]